MKTKTPSGGRSLKYEQLAHHFREQMLSGTLKPGAQLPSFAQMQAQHGVGQGTLERVYSLLESERLIVRLPKKGTFVAENGGRPGLNVIGVAFSIAPSEHPYYLHLLQGIQEVAYREQIEVLLLHGASTIQWERMDGVIAAFENVTIPSTMPAVTLLRQFPGVPCVLADEYGGIKSSVEYLISQGHEKIAYLTVPGGHSRDTGATRLKGYRDALTEAGIKPVRRWVRSLREAWELPKGFADMGYEKMNQWLQEDWSKLGCTAVLAHNDDTAIGVIRAFRQANFKIPRDVSIMGFDGTEISEHVRPALSTVKIPLHEIGARAMELLLRRVENAGEKHASGQDEDLIEMLPTSLEIRGSTAPPLTASPTTALPR